MVSGMNRGGLFLCGILLKGMDKNSVFLRKGGGAKNRDYPLGRGILFCLSASDNLFRKRYFIDPFTKFVTFWLRDNFGINRTMWGMDDK